MRASSRRSVLGLTVVSAGAGLATGLSAAAGAGPFFGLHRHPASTPAATLSSPISASVLFPRPIASPPVQKTIDVYDPAPVLAPAPPAAAPRPAGASAPAPVIHSNPSQCGDDGCKSSDAGKDDSGGGGDAGGGGD